MFLRFCGGGFGHCFIKNARARRGGVYPRFSRVDADIRFAMALRRGIFHETRERDDR